MMNLEFSNLDDLQLNQINGGVNLDKVADGFLTVVGGIGTTIVLAGSAAATASVATIAAPVVVVGVTAGVIGGWTMGKGLME